MANRLSVIFNAVDHISERLSSIASIGSSTASGFQRIEDAANRAFSSAESGAGDAAEAFERAAASADSLSDAADSYGQNVSLAEQASEELMDAGDSAGDALADVVDSAERAADELDEYEGQARGAGEETEEFGRNTSDAFAALSSAIAAAGIVTALKEIGQAFMECAQMGEVFETSIAQLQTIAGGDSIAKLQGDIMGLSNETGQASESLADTAYNAISAGTAVEDSVNMAATASELAVAGFTDTSSALSVLTTAINSYGDSAGTAEHISDSLVTVQNLGVTTVAELSQQMGKAISTASAYNVSLENLESGYISITKSGINAAEGTTYLASMFNELGNTGSEISKVIQEETGKTFGQLMNDGQSVADVLGIVYEKCGQNAEAMMNMWGSAEAGKAANAIISQGLTTFNSNLETLETSAGVTAGAYAVMADTTAYAHDRMDNAAKNLQATIGSQLNPTLGKLYDAGADILNGMSKFAEENPVVVKGIAALGAGLGVVVTGVTAAAVATKVQLIPAITTFMANVNTMLGPVGWAVMAISGLTAAGTAFAAMMSDAGGETAGMTATTREQYYEVQNLNSEYEKACEELDKTDPKLLDLKYRLDEASASFEANRQTLEEFSAEVDALCESVSQISTDFHGSMSEINNSEQGTLALIQRYKELGQQTALDAVQQKEFEAVTAKLAEKYPDLADGMKNAEAGAKGYAAAMKRACEQEAEEQRQAQAQETYIDALKKREELTEELEEAQKNLNLEQERMEGLSGWERIWDNGEVDAYKEKVKEVEAAIKDNEATISEVEQGWQDLAESEEEAANQAKSFEDAVQIGIDSVKDDIAALTAAYDEAYAAALNSIEGQYSLWDKVGEISQTSMGDLNEALNSQTQYWENYAANLDTLTGKSGQIEGLSDVLKKMDDGSEESAAALEAMANASDDQLEEMVQNYQKLQEAQSQTAGEVADLESDFSSKLDDMSNKLTSTVESMNMEQDAAEAAKKTMQGYIDSIRNMIPSVTSAADEASRAAAAALGASPSKKVIPVKGHASGTVHSENIYVAGENGPELILSGGGDTVFPKSETDRIISAVSNGTDNPQMTGGVSSSKNKSVYSGTENSGPSEKTLLIKLEGSGSVNVGNGVSSEGLWESVKNNFKQAFMSMLQEEMYEEGDGAYEY